MKKFLTILGAMTLTASMAATVVSCADKADSDGDTPEDTLISLDKVITKTNLGDQKVMKTADEVLAALKNANSSLDTNAITLDFTFDESKINQTNSAFVIPNTDEETQKYKFPEGKTTFEISWIAIQSESLTKLLNGESSHDFGKTYPIDYSDNNALFKRFFNQDYTALYAGQIEINPTTADDGTKTVVISPKEDSVYFHDTITITWTEYVEDVFIDYKNPDKYVEDQLTFEIDYVLNKIRTPEFLKQAITSIINTKKTRQRYTNEYYSYFTKTLGIQTLLWEKNLFTTIDEETGLRTYTPMTEEQKNSQVTKWTEFLSSIDEQLQWLDEMQTKYTIEIEQKEEKLAYINEVREFINTIISSQPEN